MEILEDNKGRYMGKSPKNPIKNSMDYTYGQNGKWEVTKWVGNSDVHISTKDEYGDMYRFIANCGNPKPDTLPHNPNAEGNGKLIVAAVNACIKLNADNPLAVAEAINDIYEALEDIIEQADKTKLPLGADLADSIRVFGKQAIAKTKSK